MNNEGRNRKLFFETLLFGEKIHFINLQLIYCLLNGKHLNDSIEEFRNCLNEEFEPSKIEKTGLFGQIIEFYKIDFNLFDYGEAKGFMRKKNGFIISLRQGHLRDGFWDKRERIFRKDLIKKRNSIKNN